MKEFGVILAAAGKSSRFGDPQQKKVFTQIQAKPIWLYSAEKFAAREDVGQIVIVISQEDRELFNEKYAGNAAVLGIEAAIGGKERADSVRNALEKLRDDLHYVAIHDAARPCISEGDIDLVFGAAREHSAAILASPCSSTLKRTDEEGNVIETISRERAWLAQTPQVFDLKLLQTAYARHPNPSAVTDEASLVESFGEKVRVVEGNPLNIKVTTRADLKFAELALRALPKSRAFPFDN